MVAALESNNFATVSAVASVELEPPSACHGMWVRILQLLNNGGRVDLRAVGAIIQGARRQRRVAMSGRSPRRKWDAARFRATITACWN